MAAADDPRVARLNAAAVAGDDILFVAATEAIPVAWVSGLERMVRRAIGNVVARQTHRRWRFLPCRHKATSPSPWRDLLHPDGRRREAALCRIDGPPPNPFLLALVLLRLNDWVPQVRAAAWPAARHVVRSADPAMAGNVLVALIPRTRDWRRTDAGRAPLDLLAEPPVAAAFAEALRRATTGPAPTALRRAMGVATIDAHLTGLAHHARQPGVRAVAAAAVAAGEAVGTAGTERRWTDKSLGKSVLAPRLVRRPLADGPYNAATRARLAADSSPRIRRALLDGLERAGPEAAPTVRALAADPWPSIRQRAEVWLRSRDLG